MKTNVLGCSEQCKASRLFGYTAGKLRARGIISYLREDGYPQDRAVNQEKGSQRKDEGCYQPRTERSEVGGLRLADVSLFLIFIAYVAKFVIHCMPLHPSTASGLNIIY